MLLTLHRLCREAELARRVFSRRVSLLAAALGDKIYEQSSV